MNLHILLRISTSLQHPCNHFATDQDNHFNVSFAHLVPFSAVLITFYSLDPQAVRQMCERISKPRNCSSNDPYSNPNPDLNPDPLSRCEPFRGSASTWTLQLEPCYWNRCSTLSMCFFFQTFLKEVTEKTIVVALPSLPLRRCPPNPVLRPLILHRLPCHLPR